MSKLHERKADFIVAAPVSEAAVIKMLTIISILRTIKNRLSPAQINTGKWVRRLNIITRDQAVSCFEGDAFFFCLFVFFNRPHHDCLLITAPPSVALQNMSEHMSSTWAQHFEDRFILLRWLDSIGYSVDTQLLSRRYPDRHEISSCAVSGDVFSALLYLVNVHNINDQLSFRRHYNGNIFTFKVNAKTWTQQIIYICEKLSWHFSA